MPGKGVSLMLLMKLPVLMLFILLLLFMLLQVTFVAWPGFIYVKIRLQMLCCVYVELKLSDSASIIIRVIYGVENSQHLVCSSR